jgi:hypothetical protein
MRYLRRGVRRAARAGNSAALPAIDCYPTKYIADSGLTILRYMQLAYNEQAVLPNFQLVKGVTSIFPKFKFIIAELISNPNP